MRKVMFLLMGLFLLVTPSLASEVTPTTQTLKIKGFYLKASSVEYTVYEVYNDSLIAVDTDKSFKAYNIELEVGVSYAILFTKDDVTKTLFITPSEAGEFALDVSFTNDHSANLVYDPDEHTYIVNLIMVENEYTAK